MFDDISVDFGNFKLEPKRSGGARKNNGGRGGKNRVERKGGRNVRYKSNSSNFKNFNASGGKGKRKNYRRRRRGKNNGRKLSAEELEMVKKTNLDASAPRFDSAFEWKEPMFLSPFTTAGQISAFELNVDAVEFVPKN